MENIIFSWNVSRSSWMLVQAWNILKLCAELTHTAGVKMVALFKARAQIVHI
jgi:hypothetical protein